MTIHPEIPDEPPNQRGGDTKYMIITSKFPDYCSRCGGKIQTGEKVEWHRESRSVSHPTCPAKAPNAPGTIKISQGQGYGGREYHDGQVLRHEKHGILEGWRMK